MWCAGVGTGVRNQLLGEHRVLRQGVGTKGVSKECVKTRREDLTVPEVSRNDVFVV